MNLRTVSPGLGLAFALLALLLSQLAHGAEPARANSLLAAKLELTDAQGETRPLARLVQGKTTILHFWATWCAPCREELPAIAAFRQELEVRGLADRLIVISVDTKPRQRVDAFLRDDLGLAGFTTYQADSRLVGALLRLPGYPATVFLDANAAETGRHVGPFHWLDDKTKQDLLNRLR